MPAKVYLKPMIAQRQGHHTAYVSDGHVRDRDGKCTTPVKLEFINGKAVNVENSLYERFADAGVADVKKPKQADDDE